MTKNEALEKKITLWWWNHGYKKKDFEGTYKEWFLRNEIKIIVKRKRILFVGSYGSMSFDIYLTKDFIEAFNLIIKLCLTFLGDKAFLVDGYGRQYKINWR